MFRRLLVSLCVVCLCASLAYAGANVAKVRDFVPDPSKEDPGADGVATLVFNSGGSNITVVIQGFQPGETYGVALVFLREEGDVYMGAAQAITTNPSGNGSWSNQWEGPADITINHEIHIIIDDGNGVVGPEDEVRAIGLIE